MQTPHDPTLDNTIRFLREGYDFLEERRRALGAGDIFELRLMGRRAVAVVGEEAARMFYTPDRFTRRGALPPTTLRQLQDKGSVQTLDGAAHRLRKARFLPLTGPEQTRRMGEAFEARWREALPGWTARGRIVLLEEAEAVLTRAVCDWAGIPLDDREARERTAEFSAMIDGAGAAGRRALRGLLKRERTERWARQLIRRVRDGRLAVASDSPLADVAAWQDERERPLSPTIAAVELLNLLRPTVAVARFVMWCGLALHRHPEWRGRLDSEAAREAFAQEVRRLSPFFPAVGGRALEPFAWGGRAFERGDWVLLDAHGTNRDPRLWEEPLAFRPERFLERPPGLYDLIPQGAGVLAETHRCPGEGFTVEIMKRALALLTGTLAWDVPPQDLSVDPSRLPARPASGLILDGVRPL